MENIIESNKIKTIYDLLGYNFLIKNYQRGYRWGEKEVKELLNDLNDFINKHLDSKDETTYCLQPLIVKKIGEKEYEVIDGQQRLTTIHMLIDYVYRYSEENFNIKYENRDGSEAFLNSLCQKREISDEERLEIEKNKNNIDFYFMKKAMETIKKWFKDEKEKNHQIRENAFEELLTRKI